MVQHSIFEALSSPTNTAACCLSRQLCLALDATTTLDDGLKLIDIKHAKDGTKKLVIQITSGPAKGKAIESVLIPMVRGPQQAPRYTLCVSSQSGCAMACAFCHTGKLGLLGSLSAGLIVGQYLLARRVAKEWGEGGEGERPILRIVFMGMGEPFDNYDDVMKVCMGGEGEREGGRNEAPKRGLPGRAQRQLPCASQLYQPPSLRSPRPSPS